MLQDTCTLLFFFFKVCYRDESKEGKKRNLATRVQLGQKRKREREREKQESYL